MDTRTTASQPWFQVRRDSRARFRLFCFPYAGGSSSIYRPWSRQIRSDIEVVPVLLPGRELRLREPTYTRFDPLVEALTREIFPFLDRPFAFFGHSMGAITSFEVARRLRLERGIETEHLFISGRRAPQLPQQDPEIHNLPDAEFLAEVQRLNGTPKEVLEHTELMEILLPMLRGDFAVVRNYNYVPGPPLKCSITVLGGTRDESAPQAKLEGWCAQTTGRCRVRMLDGDHFFVNQQQPAILRIIEETLLARV
jgi:medium-chain acyl-[acyl-carrier-protein] hydrolase